MVGRHDHPAVGLCQQFEEVGDDRMTEPREGDATVGTLVVGEFAHHLRLRTGMTEHVDEVEHDHVQVVLLERIKLLQQFVGIAGTVHLMIRKGVLPPITLQLGSHEGLLIQVLTFLLVLIHPEVRKQPRDLVGHQSAEDGVARILCGSG